MGTTYEADTVAWASEQVALLRAGRLAEIDIEHIAEEIEEIGKGDMRALRSAIREALEHLLKLKYSPAVDPRADWKASIAKQRAAISDLLMDSPGLKPKIQGLFEQSWRHARKFALIGMEKYGETPNIPEVVPFALGQVLDDDFFPESESEQQRQKPTC